MNDSSISTNCSLIMATGFTKRKFNLEQGPTNPSLLTPGEIDLEKIKSDIFITTHQHQMMNLLNF